MQPPIKLVIADDHPIVRDGIRSILSKHPRIILVGEAGSGTELVNKCRQLNPDVVLTDVVMHDSIDAEQAVRILEETNPLIRIVAMSMHERYHDIMRMINAGAIGYISKNAEKEEYLEAIEYASRSKVYYCRRIRKRIKAAGAHMKHMYTAIEFSERELQVLNLLCKGFSNAEISEALEVSIRTVEGYRLKILEKFDTNNILKVIMYAISVGLVKIDEAQ
jgi:DNA-binding NarL/FixJ family response regulator